MRRFTIFHARKINLTSFYNFPVTSIFFNICPNILIFFGFPCSRHLRVESPHFFTPTLDQLMNEVKILGCRFTRLGLFEVSLYFWPHVVFATPLYLCIVSKALFGGFLGNWCYFKTSAKFIANFRCKFYILDHFIPYTFMINIPLQISVGVVLIGYSVWSNDEISTWDAPNSVGIKW